MNKQRLAILICAAIGMLAIFMPWVNLPFGISANGTKENVGWVTFVVFIAPLVVSLAGDQKKSIVDNLFYIAVSAGILNAAIAIWKIADFNNGISVSKENFLAEAISSSVSVGFGLYLVAIAGITLPVLAYLLKDKKSQESIMP